MARMRRATAGGNKGAPKRRRKRFQEQAKCRFCREKVEEVDYKDVNVLSKLTTQQGKMFSRKRSGNCAHHQRSVMRAVKRARFLALLPYVS
jgi:small subunit ribosomal protein S18